jgi:cyclopropane fatty-acyl-phospholipid synthase-like methyltransferase
MTSEKYHFEKRVYSRKDYRFYFESNKEIVNSILKLKKSGKVLDLGCGEGGTSLDLAKLGFEVTCVDISKKAIDEINKFAKMNSIKIRAVCADIEKQNISGDYDIILCTGIFHFLSERMAKKIILQIKEHTKINGINIIDAFLFNDPTRKENEKGFYFKEGAMKEIYSNKDGWKIKEYKEYSERDDEEGITNKLVKLVAIKTR